MAILVLILLFIFLIYILYICSEHFYEEEEFEIFVTKDGSVETHSLYFGSHCNDYRDNFLRKISYEELCSLKKAPKDLLLTCRNGFSIRAKDFHHFSIGSGIGEDREIIEKIKYDAKNFFSKYKKDIQE